MVYIRYRKSQKSPSAEFYGIANDDYINFQQKNINKTFTCTRNKEASYFRGETVLDDYERQDRGSIFKMNLTIIKSCKFTSPNCMMSQNMAE